MSSFSILTEILAMVPVLERKAVAFANWDIATPEDKQFIIRAVGTHAPEIGYRLLVQLEQQCPSLTFLNQIDYNLPPSSTQLNQELSRFFASFKGPGEDHLPRFTPAEIQRLTEEIKELPIPNTSPPRTMKVTPLYLCLFKAAFPRVRYQSMLSEMYTFWLDHLTKRNQSSLYCLTTRSPQEIRQQFEESREKDDGSFSLLRELTGIDLLSDLQSEFSRAERDATSWTSWSAWGSYLRNFSLLRV